MTNQTSLFKMVPCKYFGNTAAVSWALPGVCGKLFALHIRCAEKVGTATMSGARATFETELFGSMQNHGLSSDESMDLVVICSMAIADAVKKLAYPHMFNTDNDVLATLGNKSSSALRAWQSQAMLPFSTALGLFQCDHGEKNNSEDEITDVQHPGTLIDSGWPVVVRRLILNNYFWEASGQLVTRFLTNFILYVMYSPQTTFPSGCCFALIIPTTPVTWRW